MLIAYILAFTLAVVPFGFIVTFGIKYLAGWVIFQRNKATDDSNMLNYPIAVSFVSKHPEELLKLRYVYPDGTIGKCPFVHVTQDLFSGTLRNRS